MKLNKHDGGFISLSGEQSSFKKIISNTSRLLKDYQTNQVVIF
jgi:hypothetical protein